MIACRLCTAFVKVAYHTFLHSRFRKIRPYIVLLCLFVDA